MKTADEVMGTSTISNPGIVFGSPAFWPKVHGANKRAFDAFSRLADLADEMFSAADNKAEQDFEKAVYILTRLTLFGLNDVVILVANGSGTGSMKIVRSMFESSALAEYLRLNPHEVKDYIEFGKVIAWRRYQWQLSNAPATIQLYPPGAAQSIEDGYNSIKGRFTNSKGKVRSQWTSKSISEMADAIGRAKQYETVYSLCSSLHHANYEGLSGYAELNDGVPTFDGPPSMEWISEALMYAHSYSCQTLNTLNDCCHLGLDKKVDAVGEEFLNVWNKDKG
jgi:hypothetical protein